MEKVLLKIMTTILFGLLVIFIISMPFASNFFVLIKICVAFISCLTLCYLLDKSNV